jgi:hypothetical protein
MQKRLRKYELPSRQFPIYSDEYGDRYLEDKNEYYGFFLEGSGPLFGYVEKKKKEAQDESM